MSALFASFYDSIPHNPFDKKKKTLCFSSNCVFLFKTPYRFNLAKTKLHSALTS